MRDRRWCIGTFPLFFLHVVRYFRTLPLFLFRHSKTLLVEFHHPSLPSLSFIFSCLCRLDIQGDHTQLDMSGVCCLGISYGHEGVFELRLPFFPFLSLGLNAHLDILLDQLEVPSTS